MTIQEIIQERNKVFEQLLEEGWDYDDARFATMTATNKPNVLLAEQSQPQHPLLVALAGLAASVPARPIPAFRPSPDSMYDQDH